MEAPIMKYNYNMVAIIVVVIVGILGGLDEVYGGGECGKTSPEAVLYKLAPCAAAAQDKNAKVPKKCCTQIKMVDKSCLCAIILSPEAHTLGLKLEAAMTIPKRCKIANCPVGYILIHRLKD